MTDTFCGLPEMERLNALRSYGSVQEMKSVALDDLATLVPDLCGTAMACISVLEAGKEWLLAGVGVGWPPLRREDSFCRPVLEQDGILMVPDASLDPRFAHHPLVAGEPQIRLLAGTPLVNPEGARLGALYVLDRVPGTLSVKQLKALEVLGRQAMGLLTSQRQSRTLRMRDHTLRAVFEASQDGVLVLDQSGRICQMNVRAGKLLEVPEAGASGGHLLHLLVGAESRAVVLGALKAAIGGEKPRVEVSLPNGQDVVGITFVALRAEGLEGGHVLAVAQDMTDRRRGRSGAADVNGFYQNGAAGSRAMDLQEKRPAALESHVDAESDMPRSDVQYRGIMELSSDMIFLNRQGRISYINQAGVKLLGALDAGQIVGRNPLDFFAPEFHGVIRNRIAFLLSKPSTAPLSEMRIIGLEGTMRHVEVTSTSYLSGDVMVLQVLCRDITRRVLMEQALRRSNELMKAVADGTPDAVFVKDLRGRYLMANDAAARIMGRTEQEVPGRTDEELFSAEDAAIIRRNDLAVIQAGKPVTTEEVLTTGGVSRTYQATKAPWRNSDGKIVGLIGISRDVSHARDSAESIRKSKERLRIVTENARVGLVILSPERRYLYTNKTYSEILDLPPGPLEGRTVESVLGDLYQTQIRPRLDQAFAGERVSYDLVRPSAGGARHYAVRYEPTQADGETRVVVVITEVTERIAAEEARQTSDLRYRSLFQYAPDGIVIADAESNYLDGNASICRMLGYTREEFIGLNARDVLAAEEVPLIAETLDAIHADRGFKLEWNFRRKDGSVFPAEVMTTRMPDGLLLGIIRDISHRRKVEAESREATRFAQSTIDALSAKLCVLDGEGQLLAVNAAWKRFGAQNGAPAGGLTQGNYLKVCEKARGHAADEARRFGEGIKAVVRGEIPEFVQEYACHAPAEKRWFAGRVTRFSGEGPVRVVVAHENISLRKRAEDRLIKYAAALDEAQSLARLGRWEWEFKTGRHEWSPIIYDIYGRDPALGPASEVEIARYFTPESWRTLEQAINSALDRKSSYQCDAEVVRPDGSRRWITARGDVRFDEAGIISGMHGTVQDITQQQQALERIKRLMESNIQGVFFWKKDGAITEANDAFLLMTGYTRADLEAGRLNWRTMTPPEYEAADQDALLRIEREGNSATVEKEYFRKDGGRIPVLAAGARFKDNADEGVSFALDLTERRKLEQQFLRAQRMESIGTLAGGIAHDLNNALAPIMMSLDLLKRRFPDAESLELLGMVGSSAQRGAAMVRQLLTFAKGAEGSRVEVPTAPMVEEIGKITNETFLKHIAIQVQVEPGIWSMWGDSTQIHQILLNLCVNARDAMPEGGGLTVSASNFTLEDKEAGTGPPGKPGRYVLLRVKDTGTGMPPEVLEKIFDPFFTTKEIGKGTGLGLSTTITIIRNHGGFIHVESQPGQGTEFQVYLPAWTGGSAALREQARGKDMAPGQGQCILVIDDEPIIREMTALILRAHSYQVILAEHGLDGMLLFEQHQQDIAAVLVDMMMPVMDGPATIAKLRALQPDLPVIAASGITDYDCEDRAKALGINYILSKPFSADDLLQLLEQALDVKS